MEQYSNTRVTLGIVTQYFRVFRADARVMRARGSDLCQVALLSSSAHLYQGLMSKCKTFNDQRYYNVIFKDSEWVSCYPKGG